MDGKYGLLINKQNITLHRSYFKEMVKLIGINVIYRAPRPSKTWTTYEEIDSNYYEPVTIGCIFNEHPDQRSMKKMGWISELQENESIISVEYDLPEIQVGALFEIPSGIDDAKNRMFRVKQLSNIMIYPASISCVIVPEYESNYEKSLTNHTHNSLNQLREDGDGNLF